MRENRANKSYNSRLTRWVDRLLQFDFSIDHLPASKMGLVDYMSRDPQQKAVNISAYDEQFIVAKLDVIKRSAKRFLLNTENTEEPGANTLYNPSRLFLERFVRGLFLASFTSNEASVRGTDCPTSGWGITLDSLFGSSFLCFVASLLSLSLFNSSSVSLLLSWSQFSSEMSSSHLTVSKSKYLFKTFLYVRLFGSGLVVILLNGVFAFLPKCASNGDILMVF